MLVVLLGFCAAADAAAPETKGLAPAGELPAIKELPNPFVFLDGAPVRSREDWPRRRAELLAQVLHYEYGHLPPAPGNVKAKEASWARNTELKAIERKLVLTMGPDDKVSTRVEITVPFGSGPFPVVITGDLCWGKIKQPIIEEVVRRGYILVEFDRTGIAPDKKDDRSGIYTAYPDYDCGAAAAWAWGYHRVIDYLLTLDYVDKDRIAVTGHSRGGKAALLAGATDTRIAMTNPNNSGCGGAGNYRFADEKAEKIENILKNFPFWFQPRFGEFIGKIDRLPFDQHSVKALVAPRALLTTEALGDLWANPRGTQQSHQAAAEVFAFLGVPQKLGIHFREGKHEHNLADWRTLLDFADLQFSGKKTETRFDQMAFPDAPKAYSWSRPN